MQKQRHLLDRLVEDMDLTGEPIPGQPVLELAGDGRILMENHQGIIQYSCDKICVKVKFGHVAVCGRNLELAKMTREQLVITGNIDAVTIHRRNGK